MPLVEVYQKGPKPIRSATKARQLMGILEKHHWVVYQPGKYKFEGFDRTEFWYVVPQ